MIILFAQQDAAPMFESLRGGFSGPTQSTVLATILAVLISAVALAAIFFYIRRRQDSSENLNNPRELFDELCSAHNLSSDDRQLLHKIARTSQSRRLDRLFLRPDLFSQSTHPEDRGEIEGLRDRLFHDSPKPQS